MSGMSIARAAVERDMSVLILEQGTVCGQGATAAAKQGQVNAYQPQSNEVLAKWATSFSFRWESLLIYQEMTARGYDLGLDEHGGAQVFEGGNLVENIGARLQYYIAYLALAWGQSTESTYENRGFAQSLAFNGLGAIWDGRKGRVNPCKVLTAWRHYVEQGRGGGVVMENVTISSVAFGAGDYPYTVSTSGGSHRAKALVVAVGTWHDAFMAAHFPAACANALVVRAVAGEIAIFSVDPPIAQRAPIIDSTDAPYMVAGIFPPPANDCSSFSPKGAEGFTTTCGDVSWAHYVYAVSFGSSFAVGTRRMAVKDPSDCHGPSYQAPRVAWNEEQYEWALARASTAYRLEGRTVTRLENYSACFPVAADGHLWTKELACDGYKNLFVLNGLAGGGIARGPAAGKFVSDRVADALGGGLPVQMAGVGELNAAYTYVAGVLVAVLVALVLMLTCCGSVYFYMDLLKLSAEVHAWKTGDRPERPLLFHKNRMCPEWHEGGASLRAKHLSMCVVVLLTTLLVLLVLLTMVAPEALVFCLVFLLVIYLPVVLTACCRPICNGGSTRTCCKRGASNPSGVQPGPAL